MVIEEIVESRKAKVVLTTSHDENYGISNMLDGKEETFWMSTGMFPQEIMFQLESQYTLKKIQIISTGIKQLKLETTDKSQPIQFSPIFEKQLADEGSLQAEEILLEDQPARYLKLQILNGYHNFISIHSIKIEANI
ncbi:hypothetical protein ABK040_014140 [Willaertia magna]